MDEKTTLEASDDVASIILGGTWRMPKAAEIAAMKAATYWTLDDTDMGYYVFMPLEGDAGKINDEKVAGHTYDKSNAILFFPIAGNGYQSTLFDAGYIADYWVSTLNSISTDKAYHLYFNSDGGFNAQSNDSERFRGFSVRPVSN